MPTPDLDKLKSILLTSGTQQKNPALHQVIWSLIDFVKQNINAINTSVGSPSGGGGAGAINQSILTVNDDQATLPNSRQLRAGSGVHLMNNGRQLVVGSVVRPHNDIEDALIGAGARGPRESIVSPSGGFTPGSVIFVGPAGIFAQDNTNFFFDDTNNILRVGIIAGGTGVNDDLRLRATTGVGTTNSRVFIETGNNGAVQSVEVTGDGTWGRLGVGTVGNVTLDKPLIVYGTGVDIGYLADFRAQSGGSYIQISTGIGANEAAGFSLFQRQNVVEWNFAVIGNDANAVRWRVHSAGINVAYFTTTQNFIIDSSRSDSDGSRMLILGDGTAPTTMASNTAGLYANDVGGTVQLFAINEANEVTRLTWPTPQTYSVSNVTTDRTYDADATTLDEIADVLGTLIDDLRNRGIVA